MQARSLALQKQQQQERQGVAATATTPAPAAIAAPGEERPQLTYTTAWLATEPEPELGTSSSPDVAAEQGQGVLRMFGPLPPSTARAPCGSDSSSLALFLAAVQGLVQHRQAHVAIPRAVAGCSTAVGGTPAAPGGRGGGRGPLLLWDLAQGFIKTASQEAPGTRFSFGAPPPASQLLRNQRLRGSSDEHGDGVMTLLVSGSSSGSGIQRGPDPGSDVLGRSAAARVEFRPHLVPEPGLQAPPPFQLHACPRGALDNLAPQPVDLDRPLPAAHLAVAVRAVSAGTPRAIDPKH